MSPNSRRMMTARERRRSAERPVALTMVARRRVASVKLVMKPRMTPRGRLLSAPRPVVRMIGRRGRMQGERMVTSPARKE